MNLYYDKWRWVCTENQAMAIAVMYASDASTTKFSTRVYPNTPSISDTVMISNQTGNVTGGSGGYTSLAQMMTDGTVVDGGPDLVGAPVFPRTVHVTAPAKLGMDSKFEIELVDGARFIYSNGNYRIEDKDAKVIYKANRVKTFNRFLNASDLLTDFIGDIGKLGAVHQGNILDVPIELFINWLIIKSAEKDGDPPPEGVPPLHQALLEAAPRCRCCGEMLPDSHRNLGLEFIDAGHMQAFMRANGLVEDAPAQVDAPRELVPA